MAIFTMLSSSDNAISEVDANYRAFLDQLADLLPVHRNKYALMRHGKVVNIYANWDDAWRTGTVFFADDAFSVQKITDEPVDLGFFSHAVPLREL